MRLAAVGLLVLITLTACGSEPSLRPQVLKHEELIAGCMHRNGFSYTVAVPADLVIAEERRAGKSLEQAIADRPANPNDAMLATLPEAQQKAWGDTLYGTDTTEGCYYKTYQAAWGQNLADVAAKGEELKAKVEADPAVKTAFRTYVDCMRGKGFRVNSLDGAYALGAEAEKAHDQCVPAYETVYDEVYLKRSR